VLEVFSAFFSNNLFLCFWKNWQGVVKMENISLGEKELGAMCVEDCNSAHKNHGSVAMEGIMAFLQQPPLGPLVSRTSLGGLNCYKPHNIIQRN
jgi:hypothetical protein